MDDLQIYSPFPNQWLDYRKLRLRATSEDPDGFWPPYSTAITLEESDWKNPIIEAEKNLGRWILFAKYKGELAGMISAKKMEKLPGGVKLRDMFVVKEARGLGIGKKLIHKLLESLEQDTEVKVVRLGVFTSQQAAVNLYKSVGFEVLRQETEHFPDGLTHETFIMEKTL